MLEVGDGEAATSAKLPLPEELLYWGEVVMEAGEVVRQEELVPLVLDCCRQWDTSPRAGGRGRLGRLGSLHSEITELALVSGLGRLFSVESLELGSLSSRSA